MKTGTIGIIGGMGPLATADLFQKIIQNTRASCDQEHLHILIDNNTAIPDRTAALLHGGADPFPQMLESALRLEEDGADCLLMPCNTAHYFHGQLQERVHIPLLNMLELTCQALKRRGITRAGLLATTGTIETGIYQRAAQKLQVELLLPTPEEQTWVMDLIYQGVKAGDPNCDPKRVQCVIDRLLTQRGAQAVILGCTELPLAVQMYRIQAPCVDPTLELAKGAIRQACGVLCRQD